MGQMGHFPDFVVITHVRGRRASFSSGASCIELYLQIELLQRETKVLADPRRPGGLMVAIATPVMHGW